MTSNGKAVATWLAAALVAIGMFTAAVLYAAQGNSLAQQNAGEINRLRVAVPAMREDISTIRSDIREIKTILEIRQKEKP